MELAGALGPPELKKLKKIKKLTKTKKTHIRIPGPSQLQAFGSPGAFGGIAELEGLRGLGARWLAPGIPSSEAGWGLGSQCAFFFQFLL